MSRGSENPKLSASEQVRLQGEFIQSAEIDDAFRKSGGRTYWAIDTNIVRFICDPMGSAFPAAGERTAGFAAIFDDDPHDLVQVLSEALADYIVKGLSPSAPLFVPPPLDKQVVGFIDSISMEGAEAAVQLIGWKKRAEELTETLRSDVGDADKEEAAAQLLWLTLVRNRSNQLSRLKELFESDRVRFFGMASEQLPPELRNAAVNPSSDEKFFLRCMIEDGMWRDFLSRRDRTRGTGRNFNQKATAISSMYRLNQRLAKLSRDANGEAKARLNFLTGDTSLVSQAGIAKTARTSDVQSDFEKFCQVHFRHPRSLLANIDLLRLSDTVPSGAGHFFDLWAHWHPVSHDVANGDVSSEIKEKWISFLRKAILSFDLAKEATELEDWQLSSAEAFSEWQEQNRGRIEDEIAQFWEQCFYFATQGLVRFGEATIQRSNSRNVPPVYLESWSSSYELIAMLINWHSPSDFDLGRYKRGLEKINAEFETTGRSSRDARYAYYLAHAVLFAARGNWSIAAKVAGFASVFARSGSFEPGEANGREAIYIEAFCSRHAARSEEDLSELPELVERARRIAISECASTKAGSEAKHDCVDVRFDCELNSIDITRWLFKRFSAVSRTGEELLEEKNCLQGLIESSGRLYKRVVADLDEKASMILTDSEERKRFSVLFRLRVRLLVNLFGLSIYARDGVFDHEFQRSLLRESEIVEEIFGAGSIGLGGKCFSSFGQLVRGCVRSRAALTDKERKLGQLEVARLLPAGGDAHLATFPYDTGRDGRLSWIRKITQEST